MKPFLGLLALVCVASGGARDAGRPPAGHLVLEATEAGEGRGAAVATRGAVMVRAGPGADRAAFALVGDSAAVVPLRRHPPRGLVWLALAAAVGAGVTGWLTRRAPPS